MGAFFGELVANVRKDPWLIALAAGVALLVWWVWHRAQSGGSSLLSGLTGSSSDTSGAGSPGGVSPAYAPQPVIAAGTGQVAPSGSDLQQGSQVPSTYAPSSSYSYSSSSVYAPTTTSNYSSSVSTTIQETSNDAAASALASLAGLFSSVVGSAPPQQAPVQQAPVTHAYGPPAPPPASSTYHPYVPPWPTAPTPAPGTAPVAIFQSPSLPTLSPTGTAIPPSGGFAPGIPQALSPSTGGYVPSTVGGVPVQGTIGTPSIPPPLAPPKLPGRAVAS